MWVSGVRSGKLYTIAERPLDPRWSKQDLHKVLAWCATGQHLGWSDSRSFQVAEALLMKHKYSGIMWPDVQLQEDMLLITREQHEPK